MAKKIGPVKVFMDQHSLNGMLCCLDYLIAVSDGDWATAAERIKKKILQHGRTFTNHDAKNVAICFYEDEAAVLLKAFSLFVYLTRNPEKDYYDLMQKQKSETGDSNEM